MASFPPSPNRPTSSNSPTNSNQRRSRPRCIGACATCKRRKERCDGRRPCARCVYRRVDCVGSVTSQRSQATGAQIGSRPTFPSFLQPQRSTGRVKRRKQNEDGVAGPNDATVGTGVASGRFSEGPSALESSRLIQDRKGRYMFIGDSATLSFLQVLRHQIERSIGACQIVDDPLRYLMVEMSPASPSTWLNPDFGAQQVPEITLSESRGLVARYSLATNCLLDLFDAEELLAQLPAFIEGRLQSNSIPAPTFYLVLAIGAQTSSEDKDDLASQFFARGRYLTAQDYMEDPSISAIQAYTLITFYLLGACRRNAAFMYLGIAVRAAYAIGLHRKDVASSFSTTESQSRERLWKVIRILDLFMSASLGRPPSTSETRDTECAVEYSASIDLCAIFENILTNVYSRRMISTEALREIGAHHRRWASRFFRGLATDSILPEEVIEDGLMPNIGLLHVKEAYYWTIMLLTWPFLTESVARHNDPAKGNTSQPIEPCTSLNSDKVLIYASVDSAIRTVELLTPLRNCEVIPKRLPFVVNSLFVASLVLGMAYFGDLHQLFPLETNLKLAKELLGLFPDDAIARRNAEIVGYLNEACQLFREKQAARNMNNQSQAIRSVFGQIHGSRSQAVTRAQSPSVASAAPNNSNLPQSAEDAHELVGTEADDPFELFPDGIDFASLPYPAMSPRTVWFNSIDDVSPMFSTIGNHTW